MALTNRQQLMLAALAAGGREATFAPVQVQKLFFLIDKTIPEEVGGEQFHFTPYDYGPFDSAVYTELENLRREGLVRIEASAGRDRRRYGLSMAGLDAAAAAADELSPRARDYLGSVAKWVLSLGFAELVGAIYRQYPEMKENSVFRE